MEQKKKMLTGEKVVAFPVSGGQPAKNVREARNHLKLWQEGFLGAGGLFSVLFRAFDTILQAIESGLPEKEVQERVEALVVECHSLHEVLGLAPFNHPNIGDLKALAGRFSVMEQELQTAQTELAQQRQQNQKLEAKAVESSALKQELETLRCLQIPELIKAAGDFSGRVVEAIKQLGSTIRELDKIDNGMQQALVKVGIGQVSLPEKFLSLNQQASMAIVQEIERRQNWLAELDQVQEQAEGRRDSAEASIEEVESMKRFGDLSQQRGATRQLPSLAILFQQLDAFVTDLVSKRHQVEEGLNEAKRFERSLAYLGSGVLETLAKETLPVIPELPDGDSSFEVGAISSESGSVFNETDPAQSERRAGLAKLAQQHGIIERGVFVISLYELAPPNRLGLAPTKGIITVLQAAREAGIITAYGWEKIPEVLAGWHTKGDDVERYLCFRGKIPNVSGLMYSRTNEPLPWNPNDLFTEDETGKFVECLSRSYRK